MRVCGVDPGHSGAVAVYDTERPGEVLCIDFPTEDVEALGKVRKRVLPEQLSDLFRAVHFWGVDLYAVEQVNGYGGQAGAASFVFGTAFGQVLGSVTMTGTPYTLVPPAVWKRKMGVTPIAKRMAAKTESQKKSNGKKASRMVATEVFPASASQWLRYQYHADRAEAALVAKYAADQHAEQHANVF